MYYINEHTHKQINILKSLVNYYDLSHYIHPLWILSDEFIYFTIKCILDSERSE